MPVIKCKTWGEGQGDYVLVDEEHFNPDFHVRLDEPSEDKTAEDKPRRGRPRKDKEAEE